MRYRLGKKRGLFFFPLKGLVVNTFVIVWAVHSFGFCGPVACSYIAFFEAVLLEKQKLESDKKEKTFIFVMKNYITSSNNC